MIVQPITYSPTPWRLLAADGQINQTESIQPDTVEPHGTFRGNQNPASPGFTAHQVWAWWLFGTPIWEPTIVLYSTAQQYAASANATMGAHCEVYAMKKTWDPTTLTWNNQPGLDGDEDKVGWQLLAPPANNVHQILTYCMVLRGKGLVQGLHLRAYNDGTAAQCSMVCGFPTPTFLLNTPSITVPIIAYAYNKTTNITTLYLGGGPYTFRKGLIFNIPLGTSTSPYLPTFNTQVISVADNGTTITASFADFPATVGKTPVSAAFVYL